MKGYLRSAEGVYQLAPKVTTIGREGCDLVLQCPGVDFQHSVLEYSEQEDCFVLQDLNTAQGTYVNDCRVQNAAVRLAPGDVIRFGFSSQPYELEVENSKQQLNYPPVHQRPAWTQPLTVISDPGRPASMTAVNQNMLPYLKTMVNTTTTWDHAPVQNTPVPHPPSMRSRPLSASNVQTRSMRNDARTITGPGWVGGASPVRGFAARSEQNELLILQEKEQKIMRLTEEVNRLMLYESESNRKEQIIKQLREEIMDLQQQLRHLQVGQATTVMSTDAEITRKLLQLEGDLALKITENNNLREQLSRSKMDTIKDTNGFTRQDYNDRVTEVNSLRCDYERMKKDKNITSGLVTQMQRDMSNKDSTISRLTREIEIIKKEIREKDVQLSAMQSKFKRVSENKKSDEERDSREKEVATLRQKFKETENKVTDQKELISGLRQELEKVTSSINNEKEVQKKIQSEMEAYRSQLTDVQRTERAVRVDLEQLSKKGERFRNRVVQVTYSTPGIRAPDNEISDDDLLDQLKKVVDERTELVRKNKDLHGNVKEMEGSKKATIESSRKMKSMLTESGERLRDKGRLSCQLKQELSIIQSLSCDESIAWVKECAEGLIRSEIEWQTDVENALEKCGVNVKISEKTPAEHLSDLYSRWEIALNDKDKMAEHVKKMEEQHITSMNTALDNLRQELENKCTDMVEKARLEGEEKLNLAIDDIKAVEEEKRENAVCLEKNQIAELEASLQTLQQSIVDRDAEQNNDLEQAKVAIAQLEEYKKIEAQLKTEVETITRETSSEIERLKKEVSQKDGQIEQDVVSYREQIKQHSVTICAMEERLNKVMKKNKDYQAEITSLKHTITETKRKPALPPKPTMTKVISPEVAGLEQLVLTLRRENADHKKQVQEQQDVILGLRRDLAGASARLTDMTGELSEAQKEEMERMRELSRNQQAELTELRQQMVKLSQIVEKQSQEIKEGSTEMSKLKNSALKLKNTVTEKECRLKELEEELTSEKADKRKQLDMLQEEGQISSELTALGAQCRGERHEQVIARQREALTELRARIKTLEQVRPPLPNHDQALQQVVMLKKELAEIRATQALADDPHLLDVTSREVSRARGLVPQAQAESDIERSAHRETLEALELSETSFLTLLRGVASSLELEDVCGLRSIAHIPKDERQRLYDDRERACELLTSRIKVLKERIARKDELLAGYERDLAKLRQAEALADHKHAQVESLATDVRSRTEETQYLRESLQRTRDRLEQEKRLNQAIKSKKMQHLQNGVQSPVAQSWHKHHCPPEDLHNKSGQRKRGQNEKIKRKNYEIQVLKTELNSKHQALQSANRKLYSIETPISLGSSRPASSAEVTE